MAEDAAESGVLTRSHKPLERRLEASEAFPAFSFCNLNLFDYNAVAGLAGGKR